MRKLIFLALSVLASTSWADTSTAVVKVYSLEVKERIQNLELINVTAEKPVDERAAEPDADLKLILDEVARLDAEE